MADPFDNCCNDLSAPARKALAVTPNDTDPLVNVPKALYVGTGGDIAMRGIDGDVDQAWKNVPSGVILPIRAQYIRATGTTATDILALY
jgi:hypothetical protein